MSRLRPTTPVRHRGDNHDDNRDYDGERQRPWFPPILFFGLALTATLLVILVSQARGQAETATDGLTPELATALDLATEAAEEDGVEIVVTSGLRSEQEQQELWDAAVDEHGSAELARQWVLPPDESAHVRGAAIDVGSAGADWLLEHGYRFGLCQTFANEWWHFELATEPGTPCPQPRPHPAA